MIDINGIDSVYGAFQRAAETFADRPFLHSPAACTQSYAPGAVSWTYGAALDHVDRLRAGYAGGGVASGTRVGLVFDARLDVYLHLLALNSLGVAAVPLHSGGSDGDLSYMIGHSDATMVVAAPEYVQRLEALAGQCAVMGESDLMGGGDAGRVHKAGRAAEAALLYTSGTTGKPKGCMLSNDYFLKLGCWYNTMGGLCALDSSDRLVTPLPPNHMNALCTSFMGILLCGGCVVQLDRFHPRTWWQTVRDEGATIIHYLGVMPAMLLTLPPVEQGDDNSAVRFGFGAGCDPRHQAVFEKRFGFPLVEAWAMTESGAAGLMVANEEPRHVGKRCIGRPVPGMDYRIVDKQDVDVAPGEEGELLVRTAGDNPRAGFFSGYYKDPDATEAGWTGGWWHTGDVIRQGPDGSLFFVDRRKNIIRRSGENIAAVEVEATLLQCSDVNNCAVTAVPDEIRGDEVFAFVVPAQGVTAGQEAALKIFRFCHERLTYFKAPGYIAFVDELPLTASQKVSRGQVKKNARSVLEQEACVDVRHLKKRVTA